TTTHYPRCHISIITLQQPRRSPLFLYTTLFRSHVVYVYTKNPEEKKGSVDVKYITKDGEVLEDVTKVKDNVPVGEDYGTEEKSRSEEHTSELQSRFDLVCRLLLEIKKIEINIIS